MCKVVLEAERGDEISAKAWDMHRAWQETLPGKAGEGMKRVVSSLGRYNWINKGNIRPFGYREGTETVKVVEMFKAVEAVAYNYGWSINFLTQTILSGATLEKEPRAKLEIAKASDNKVLSDWDDDTKKPSSKRRKKSTLGMVTPPRSTHASYESCPNSQDC